MQSPEHGTADTSAFSAGLLDPDAARPAQVVGPHGKQANKRYNVYRNNVTVSLVNALADIFPAVQKITGENFFRAMAREFVRAHPPQSPLLFQYGDKFADFIEEFPHAAKMPYLADVARVERGWLTAFHAADAEPLAPAALGSIDPARLGDVGFVPHPASFILRSKYPVRDIVRMNRGYADLAPVNMSQAQALLLTRPASEVRMTALDESTYAFFAAILSGESLGAAAGSAVATDPDFDLNTAITTLLASGATISVVLDD